MRFYLLAFIFTAATQLTLAAPPAHIPWFDQNSASHKAKMDAGYVTGFRPISLSVYGTRSSPQYAAVLVKANGPDWRSDQDMSPAQFSERFKSRSAEGFKVTHFSASGSGNDVVFTAIFEKTADGVIPYTRTNLGRGDITDSKTIDYWLNFARQSTNKGVTDVNQLKQEYIPVTLATYGTPSDPRFAIVLEPNPTRVRWHAELAPTANGSFDTSAGYQERVNALVNLGGLRIAETVVTDNGYWGRFTEESFGKYAARHGLTSAQLTQQMADFAKQGLMPISIQGGGGLFSRRFTAVFAESARPFPNWFIGQGFPESSKGVDSVVGAFMKKNGISQAAVVAVNDKKLIFAKGYSNAPLGTGVIKADTYFRAASVTKTLTAMAVEKVIQDQGFPTFNEDTKVQEILKWEIFGGKPPKDPNLAKMTIRQLLQHRAGIIKATPGARTIVNFLNKPLPATAEDLRHYITSNIITDYAPGTGSKYANIGYFMLGEVVVKKSNMQLVDYVRKNLFEPLGVSGVRSRTEKASPADEADYYETTSQIMRSNTGNNLVPEPYGGATPVAYQGSGGFSMKPVDLMKVIANLNVTSGNKTLKKTTIENIFANGYGWDNSSPMPNASAAKGGYTPGLQSMVVFNQGGLSYAVFWNRNEVYFEDPNWFPSYKALEKELLKLPQGADYFPKYGIPAF